jgi:hypothetical protein
LCLISQTVNSEEWFINGEPDSSKSFQGAADDFGAMIFMTTDSQNDQWGQRLTNPHEIYIKNNEIIRK